MSESIFPPGLSDRFWSRVSIHEADDCWPFMGATPQGYGVIGWNDAAGHHTARAHRLAYMLIHGPIPGGLTIDHLCRNRSCCNPAHLRLLTNEENGRLNAQSQRTECPAGHPYDEANTYVDSKGGRRCRTCHRLRMRKAR